MTEKIRHILIIGFFVLFIGGFSLAGLIAPDGEISAAERRPLQQRPSFSLSAVASGEFMTEAEDYFADQFPLRQEFRSIKAVWTFDVLRQKDSDGIYFAEDSVCKLTGDMDERQVGALIDKVNFVLENYLDGIKVFFAAVPDKNYFAAEANGYPAMDYDALDALLAERLDPSIEYLGYAPFESLTLSDYYRTDLHWRQENLQPVVNSLAAAMDFSPADLSGYTPREYAPFFGAYSGQAAMNVGSDTLITLNSPATDAARVTGFEFEGEKAVYDAQDEDSLDLYDLFLGGAQALLTVENPLCNNGRELYIFRDSFSSSLAPLLIESYERITLIDLRYAAASILPELIEFNPEADALFIYGIDVMNHGTALK